nr:hypothetical protein [Leptolyngbya sp. FACHB-36]
MLEVGKLYPVIADEQAEAHGLVDVTDESGEDYAFSANWFYPIVLPQSVEAALSVASVKVWRDAAFQRMRLPYRRPPDSSGERSRW